MLCRAVPCRATCVWVCVGVRPRVGAQVRELLRARVYAPALELAEAAAAAGEAWAGAAQAQAALLLLQVRVGAGAREPQAAQRSAGPPAPVACIAWRCMMLLLAIRICAAHAPG